jgi:hypothetical protein
MTPRVVVVSLAVLVAAVTGAQEPTGGSTLTAPPPGLSLTGRWELDRSLSGVPGDEVREDVRGLQSDPRPRFPPVSPGPPASPGDHDRRKTPTGPGIDVTTPGVTGVPAVDPFRRGGSSGSGSSRSRSQHGSASDYVRDLPETLIIAQRPELILIQVDDDEGRIRALVPDGARHRSLNREYQHLTRWESGVLKVETWYDDGLHVVEAFELAPEGSPLTVSFQVDDGGDPVTAERVYRLCPRAQS